MEPDSTEISSAVNRRRFLQATAAAGSAGVIWATPSVISADTAAAVGSSCGAQQNFSWSVAAPAGSGNFTGWNAGTSTFVSGGGPGTVTVTGEFAVGGPTGFISGVYARDIGLGTLGGTADNFQIQKDGASDSAFARLRLTFSQVVFGLDVTFLDVDAATSPSSHYLDRVRVIGRDSSGTELTAPTIQLGVPVGGGTVSGPTVAGSNPFDGTGSASDGGTSSNVRLVWSNTQGIKTLVFRYVSRLPTGCSPSPCTASTNQWAGISRLRFC